MSHQHNRQRKHDMDEEPRASTSRVPPKVREYISEMAVDRELERYMALSSTASSGGSGHSCALVMGAAGRPSSSSLCPRNRCRSGSSRQSSRKSLSSLLDVAEPSPPPPLPGPPMLVDQPTSGSTDDVVLIPIVMADNSQVVASKKQISASVEDLRTPTKTANQPKETQTKKTQTPESAVKSHKRLEWDPSADVGYYKRAVSTSNISTLERSVMEDCWRLPHQRSESDLNRLQMQDQKAEQSQQQQPPLASSTFVNRTISRNRESNASSRRDSQITVGTSLYGSSVASSFDYQQPSLQQEVSMTIATSSTTSTSVSATPSLTQRNSRQLEQERLFTAAQFQRVLSENKENSSNNNNNRKKKEKSRVERENKENHQPAGSHRSSVSGSGELDLGIDLLCSLIKTRSLSHGQKKHLVREIAKRISCLESGDSSSRSSRQDRRESLPTSTPLQQPLPAAPALAPALALAPTQMKTQSTNTTSSVTKIQSKATNTTSSITKIQTIAPVPAPRTHLPTARSSGESSTSCSHDLITQKTNVQAQSANSTDADVDTEQAVLQDWLNPMTQSEIEYEQRGKRGPDTERRHQLVWIESEIKRLQTLHTLLASATTKLRPKAVCPSPLHIESAGRSTVVTEQIIQTDPLVQLPSSADSRATGGSERPPPAEGSNNLSSKRQPKETQTDEVPAAPPVTPANTPLPPPQIPQRGAPPCSTPTPPPRPPPPPPPPPPERQLNHELQLQQQRSKMATPASSSGGGRSESVCSFVQQRQRQFMEHYQNQQQQQLYLLQQHHHQQQQQPNQFYYRHQQQPQCHHPHHHHQHGPQIMHQEQQRPLSPYLQMQYAHAMGSTYATPYLGENAHSCGDDDAIYYQVVNSQGAASYVQATAVATGPVAATATASTHCRTTTTSSASSMLCISSEISIPMGMVNTCETTTTTTTTHQYDDVACQRRRQQPQPQSQAQTQTQPHQMGIERMQQTHTQTMQVRPRGIAYIIQFTVNGDSEVLPETLSLQDQLQRARPEFCAKSKQRKAILNQMQMLRNVRRREMDELLGENINTNVETVDKQLQQLPPPATSRIRIFSTKEMKALTSKRCQSLPEVLAAQNRMREEQRRRHNRMMRDVFNRRLHNRVAKGQLSLNHSRTII